jgi:hypothetical protein
MKPEKNLHDLPKEELFMNLLINAIHAIEAKKKVEPSP